MSYGGSPSCGFDNVNPDGSEAIDDWKQKKITRKQGLLNWLELFYYEAQENKGMDIRTSAAKQAYEEIQRVIKKSTLLTCRYCKYFDYAIHHRSSCNHSKQSRSCTELRDGRAIACENWKVKKRKGKDSVG